MVCCVLDHDLTTCVSILRSPPDVVFLSSLSPAQSESPNPVIIVDIFSKNKLISNVTAKEILNKEELKTLLIDQIENRVRWRESVNHMIDNEVNHFIEIGPGKVLTLSLIHI